MLTVMEWHSVLMAAMNSESDVNDNHVVSINNHGGATVVQSDVVLDAIKSVIVMMEAMKSGVVMIALVMMLFLVVMVQSVPGHVMASLSAIMDLMNGIALL
jgi:hypothetical protein